MSIQNSLVSTKAIFILDYMILFLNKNRWNWIQAKQFRDQNLLDFMYPRSFAIIQGFFVSISEEYILNPAWPHPKQWPKRLWCFGQFFYQNSRLHPSFSHGQLVEYDSVL